MRLATDQPREIEAGPEKGHLRKVYSEWIVGRSLKNVTATPR